VLRCIELGEQGTRLVLIARVTAERRQRIRRKGDKIEHCEAARDVLGIGIQAAVFVDHHHARQFATRFRGAREIAAHGSRALRRWIVQILGLDPGIVLGDLLGPGKVGLEALQHRGGGKAADRILCGAIEKFAPAHRPVYVSVKKLEDFRRKIARFLSFHRISLECLNMMKPEIDTTLF
jgi:hypothetical protein